MANWILICKPHWELHTWLPPMASMQAWLRATLLALCARSRGNFCMHNSKQNREQGENELRTMNQLLQRAQSHNAGEKKKKRKKNPCTDDMIQLPYLSKFFHSLVLSHTHPYVRKRWKSGRGWVWQRPQTSKRITYNWDGSFLNVDAHDANMPGNLACVSFPSRTVSQLTNSGNNHLRWDGDKKKKKHSQERAHTHTLVIGSLRILGKYHHGLPP